MTLEEKKERLLQVALSETIPIFREVIKGFDYLNEDYKIQLFITLYVLSNESKTYRETIQSHLRFITRLGASHYFSTSLKVAIKKAKFEKENIK